MGGLPVKIRLIHGIHEPEGVSNMGMFARHMQWVAKKSDVDLWQYGFLGFWAARWENGRIARDLAWDHKQERRRGPEVWITHSNGAAVAYLAVEEHGATPDMIININPALDRWLTAAVQRVETIYSEGDRWVNLSQWLPFHIWGDQGKVGYKGRMHNTISHDASKFGGVMAYQDHCGAFAPERIVQWALFCAHRIEEFTGVKP